MNTKKWVFDYLGGLIFSGLGFLFFAVVAQVPGLSGSEIYLGGDKASVFTGFFLGVPVGGVLGIFLIHKVVLKAQDYNVMGIVLGLPLSLILWGVATVVLMGELGGQSLFVAPFLYVILARIGFRLPLHK